MGYSQLWDRNHDRAHFPHSSAALWYLVNWWGQTHTYTHPHKHKCTRWPWSTLAKHTAAAHCAARTHSRTPGSLPHAAPASSHLSQVMKVLQFFAIPKLPSSASKMVQFSTFHRRPVPENYIQSLLALQYINLCLYLVIYSGCRRSFLASKHMIGANLHIFEWLILGFVFIHWMFYACLDWIWFLGCMI